MRRPEGAWYRYSKPILARCQDVPRSTRPAPFKDFSSQTARIADFLISTVGASRTSSEVDNDRAEPNRQGLKLATKIACSPFGTARMLNLGYLVSSGTMPAK